MRRTVRDAMLLLLAWDCMGKKEQRLALSKGLKFDDIKRAEDLTEQAVNTAIERLTGGVTSNWRRLAPSSEEVRDTRTVTQQLNESRVILADMIAARRFGKEDPSK